MGKIKEFHPEKEHQKKSKVVMDSPCTISESLRIARAVVDDAFKDYQLKNSNLLIAMSLQLEIIKEVITNSGLISKDEFYNQYVSRAKEFEEMQREAYEKEKSNNISNTEDKGTTNMDIKVNDIDVKKE